MRYFITEAERKTRRSSVYFEFQKGQRRRQYRLFYWKEDSLLLHMDVMDALGLYRIIPNFNYYGITVVDRGAWTGILEAASREGAAIAEAVDELRPWAEENFRTFDYFLICGI